MLTVLSRKYGLRETTGLYYVLNGSIFLYSCFMLELPWLENKRRISCIPEGLYWMRKEHDVKHGDHFRIENVPGRDGILMHIGNYATESKYWVVRKVKQVLKWFVLKGPDPDLNETSGPNLKQIDTEGCLMPGLRYVDIDGNGTLDIADSTKAMKKLYSLLPDRCQIYIYN